MRRIQSADSRCTTRQRAFLCLLACSLAACGNSRQEKPRETPTPIAAKTEVPKPVAAPSVEPTTPKPVETLDAPVIDVQVALPFANAALDQDTILTRLATEPVSRFRPVGTSSIVFRASLAADFDAAFKSSSEKRPRAHAAEVAAYRMARLLGMDNVPPAITRNFSAEAMRSRMVPSNAWRELQSWIGINAGQVTGAAIYWIADIEESGIDKRDGTRRYTQWLKHDGVIGDDERALARDVSNMLAFDCVIGNWDRWSGGNTKGDAAHRRLYIRDHDVAFPARLSEALMRRILDRLTPAERFSKSFVERLRQLNRARFEQELARDPATTPLLDARQIGAMLDRRAAVLSHIDALIALHGAQNVLYFP